MICLNSIAFQLSQSMTSGISESFGLTLVGSLFPDEDDDEDGLRPAPIKLAKIPPLPELGRKV